MSATILKLPLSEDTYYGIQIDESKSERLSEMAVKMLPHFYCGTKESPQQTFTRTTLCL